MLSIGRLATVRGATARAALNQPKYARLSLPYPFLIMRPSAASSACVAIHSLHRSR